MLKKIISIIFCLGLFACGGAYDAADEASSQDELFRSPVLSAQGDKCHVVGGINSGKNGTYDEDGACCGDWGCTECHGSNEGKCKDGHKSRTRIVVGGGGVSLGGL